MRKKEIIIIIIVLLLIVGGIAGAKFYKNYAEKNSILKINTTFKMTAEQEKDFNDLKAALEKDKNDYQSTFELARLKQDLKDYSGALKLYEKLLKIKPNDILIMQNKGSIYYDLARYEDAEQMQLDILRKTPKWMGAYQELMMIYEFHLKDRKSTLEALLLRGLELVPESEVDFVSMLAKYYDELLGDKEKALEYYKRLTKLQGTNQQAQQRLIELKNIK